MQTLIITDLPELASLEDSKCEVICPRGEIHSCIGCFGCWVKTPGQCVIHDGYENTGAKMGNADALIFVSRNCWGGFSPFVKAVQDRAISYIHPDFEIRDGQMHHKRRYDNSLRVTAILYGDVDDGERETARSLVAANMRNYRGQLEEICFCEDAGSAVGALSSKIQRQIDYPRVPGDKRS